MLRSWARVSAKPPFNISRLLRYGADLTRTPGFEAGGQVKCEASVRVWYSGATCHPIETIWKTKQHSG